VKERVERTAHYDCALLKCYTILQHRDSSVNISLPPDQHHCSDEAKWRMGGVLPSYVMKHSVVAHDNKVEERIEDYRKISCGLDLPRLVVNKQYKPHGK